MSETPERTRRFFRSGTGATNWLWLSVCIIVLDQLTKYFVVTYLSLFERIQVMPLLDITYRQNPGAAFSFLADAGGWQRWLFIALAIGVSVAILVWMRRLPRRGQTRLAITLALVLGGALGNVIDRALYGYVIDFILVHWGDWEYPAFNVADSAISVGAVLLIYDAFFGGQQADPTKKSG